MTGLPRLYERPHGSRLVDRTEAARALGYSVTSLATVMGRGGWPSAVALLRVGRVWRKLWDLDALLAVAPPTDATVRLGSSATISDNDGILTCLECGRRFRALARHLAAVHGLTGMQYRDRHELPATGALIADGQRQAISERMQAVVADDPHALDHLDMSPARLDAIRNPARVAETRVREPVRAAQRPGQQHAAAVMQERRRQTQHDLLTARGFADLPDAIARTRHLPSRRAADVTGLGATTIRRWRTKLPSPHIHQKRPSSPE